MAKKHKSDKNLKKQTHGKFHGDISKKPGKPMDPADHMATRIKDPDGGKFDGKQLGMDPQQAVMPQTMQGPADYPGQEYGA